MAPDTAVLGTPSIRTNTLVGEGDENEAIAAVKRLVEAGIDENEWHRRRDQLVDEQPNVTERMVDVILESLIAS